MNTSYLLSVLDLYLLKEKNGKMIIEVDNIENLVKVNFSYSFDHTNKTFVKVEKTLFFSVLKDFLGKFQGNSSLSKEEVTVNNNKSIYTFSFSEGRRLSFINFSKEEMAKIRTNFLNIKEEAALVIEEIPEETSYNDLYAKTKKTKPAFSFGFANYVTLFLTTIWILDILMIALLLFKLFIK